MAALSVLLHLAALSAAIAGIYFNPLFLLAAPVGHALALKSDAHTMRHESAIRRWGFAATVGMAAFGGFAVGMWIATFIGAVEMLPLALAYSAAFVPTAAVACSAAIAVLFGVK
jgi:hypothetical protein